MYVYVCGEHFSLHTEYFTLIVILRLMNKFVLCFIACGDMHIYSDTYTGKYVCIQLYIHKYNQKMKFEKC